MPPVRLSDVMGGGKVYDSDDAAVAGWVTQLVNGDAVRVDAGHMPHVSRAVDMLII